VAGSCEYGDESSGSGATELAGYLNFKNGSIEGFSKWRVSGGITDFRHHIQKHDIFCNVQGESEVV
jgi:hypothetical protein